MSAPAWVPCACCDCYLCTIHGGHVHECACPEVHLWERSPYQEGGSEELSREAAAAVAAVLEGRTIGTVERRLLR